MKKEKLIDALGDIDDTYIKEAHAGNPEKKKWFSFLNRKRVGIVAAALCVLLVVTTVWNGNSYSQTSYSSGTGNMYVSYDASSESAAYDYTERAEISAETSYDTFDNTLSQTVIEDRKLIITANARMETKEFDETVSKLEESVAECGGYLQSSSVSEGYSGRVYTATIRIPSEAYASFADTAKEIGNVTYFSQSVEDITEEYTDLEARISSLEAEEVRVMEFYERAETLIELMEVEERLTEIRYEIDYLNSRLKNYDLLTSYSTMNITINETKVYTETQKSFGGRIRSAFTEGWEDFTYNAQDFAVRFVYAMPTLILYGILIIIAVMVYKKVKKHRKS